MGLSYFKKRTISKYSEIYKNLLIEGDVQAAISVYEKKLAAFTPYLDKSFRATYHLYRWLIFRKPEDFEAVNIMSYQQPDKSQLLKTFGTMRRMSFQWELTDAIKRNQNSDTGLVADFRELWNIDPLEQLGLTVLESFMAENVISGRDEINRLSDSILKHLPPKSSFSNEQLQKIRDDIYIHAIFRNRQFGKLYDEIDAIVIPGFDKEKTRCLLLYEWIKNELTLGEIKNAFEVINELKKQLSDEAFSILLIKIGLETFQKNTDATAGFLSSYVESFDKQKNPELYNTLNLFLAILFLKQNKYLAARGILNDICGQLRKSESVTFRFISRQSGINELLFSLLYVLTISYIAETLNWPMVHRSEDPENKDDIAFKNLTMWRQSLGELQNLLREMHELKTASGWMANFLDGLFLYADNKATITKEQINLFSAGIESFNEEKLLAKLKSIEGSLQIRLKATDEIVKLIRSNDFIKLRDFHDTVLITVSDSIPPLLRAAVYIALWMTDKKFDALSMLTSIPASQDEEEYINHCIDEVQSYNTVQRLLTECRSLEPMKQSLPALPSSDREGYLFFICSLAIALVYSKNSKYAEALSVINEAGDCNDRHLAEIRDYIHFHAAWKTDQVEVCEKIINQSESNPFLPSKEKIVAGVRFRYLIKSIGESDINAIMELIPVILQKNKIRHAEEGILKIIIYLMEQKRNDQALMLSRILRNHMVNKNHPEVEAYNFLLNFADGINYALTEQFNSALDCFEKNLSFRPDNDPLNQFHYIREFASLYRLMCEIAVIKNSREEISVLLPSLKRNLVVFADEFLKSNILYDYGYLLKGLEAYLNTDQLVTENVIVNLAESSRQLQIYRKTMFIQEIMANLNWRKRVLEDFWNSLTSGNFKNTISIYQNEIVPVFKDNIPYPIRLGSILAEWDLMTTETPLLLNRLALIEQNIDPQNHEFIRKVRNYILEGDKIKYLTNLIKDKKYEEIVDFIHRTTWADYERGSMPVPVAITLLFAYHKLKRTEEATYFAKIIRDAAGLAEWVKDYGRLLAGYVYFENRNFKQAVDAFEEISKHEILGHDVDKYWAASHFSIGLQLLDKKLDQIKDDPAVQKEHPITSFSCAMTKLTGSKTNLELIPLFFHLALKNLNSGDGANALEAFRMITEAVAPFERNEQVLSYEFAAGIGTLLCSSLLGNQGHQVSDFDFLVLSDKFTSQFDNESFNILGNYPNFPKEAINDLRTLDKKHYAGLEKLTNDLSKLAGGKYKSLNPMIFRALKHTPSKRIFFELVITKMALIQSMKNLALEMNQVPRAEVIVRFRDYFKPLDMLFGISENNDPVYFALKALFALKVENTNDPGEAFDLIEQANRLGLQSTKFNGYIYDYIKKIRQLSATRKDLLNLIDSYLISAETPEQVKALLMKNSDIKELYRINTSYTPEEIYIPNNQKSRYEVLMDRFEHLGEIIKKENDTEFRILQSELKNGISKIKKEEGLLIETEKKILSLIVKKSND